MTLVTIGIPTYMRPQQLERAVRSALAQDHGRIEVLVSDNASPDPAVERLGSRFARADARVRFVRQPENLGSVRNFQWLLEAASGDYFMWLSDDDWIDPNYVTRCLQELRQHSGVVLVGGLARYYQGGKFTVSERPYDLRSSRPGERVISYFSRVTLNGILFGLARRSDLLPIGFPPGLGGDWMLVAALAARGRVVTLGDVHVHRSIEGSSADIEGLARSFGMRRVGETQAHVRIASRVWREIAVAAPAFGGMNRMARMCVAGLASALIVGRFTLVILARRIMGDGLARSLETRVSAWLRAREHPRR